MQFYDISCLWPGHHNMEEPEIWEIVPGNMFGEAKTHFQLNITKAVNVQISPAAKAMSMSGPNCSEHVIN